MRARLFLTGMAVIVSTATACATAPVVRKVKSEFSVADDFDRVWGAVISTFADLNLPIESVEKDSGLIATDWINFTGSGNEEYCDCGGLGALLSEESRSGRFNVFVSADSSATRFRVTTSYQQVVEFGRERSTRPCVSTGGLEKRIAESVNRRLGHAAAPK